MEYKLSWYMFKIDEDMPIEVLIHKSRPKCLDNLIAMKGEIERKQIEPISKERILKKN